MGKKGDTLIEVVLAVGIFSLVAIAVVAIMNSGTSNVQTALELTMTRNEIDTQAEALRFIQSSYVAEKDLPENSKVYTKLWKEIVGLAKVANEDISQYNPTTCANLYNKNSANGVYGQNAFVINTRKLAVDPNAALVKATATNVFAQTLLYPRLIYGTDSGLLIDANLSDKMTKAEGLYIVAVRDPKSTVVNNTTVDKNGTIIRSGSAYYDFYIRSCWYGSGADTPSTISTVVRLYDPDMTLFEYSLTDFSLVYDANGGSGAPEAQSAKEAVGLHVFDLSTKIPTSPTNGDFFGWSEDGTCNTKVYIPTSVPGGTDTSIQVKREDPNKTLYAVWQCEYSLTYKSSVTGTTNLPANQTELHNKREWIPTISSTRPVKSGQNFWRWQGNDGKYYYPGQSGPKLTAPNNMKATLTAQFIKDFTISYTTNTSDGSGWAPATTVCKPNATDVNATTNCTISSQGATRTGYKFIGWAESASGEVKYQPGSTIVLDYNHQNKKLYAKWREQNDVITIKLTFPSRDCDSHVQGQKSNGTTFHAYYSSKVGNDIDGTIIASLDYDRTSGGTETFTLNTKGGKTYYYYVHNYSGCNLSSSNTYVKVTSKNGDFAEQTFKSSSASGSGSYWNVFAYKDGRLVTKETKTSSPSVSY